MSQPTATRPNILFIVADDLGWADLSVYGQTEYTTPHLDRLAVQGVRQQTAPGIVQGRAGLVAGGFKAQY